MKNNYLNFLKKEKNRIQELLWGLELDLKLYNQILILNKDMKKESIIQNYINHIQNQIDIGKEKLKLIDKEINVSQMPKM